jgi:broad specificity phosphatase PhoE
MHELKHTHANDGNRMPPTKIMLIRHGEKQISPPPAGIDENGTHDKHALTPRGWQRAGALVPLFRGQIPNPSIARPTAIFAAAIGDDGPPILSPDGEEIGKSLRPQETIAPLSRAMSLDVNADFFVGDEAQVVQAISALDGVVLVAWEHDHLPAIARAFSANAPEAWPGADVFDLVWVLDHRGDTYAFESVQQSLLDGDAI